MYRLIALLLSLFAAAPAAAKWREASSRHFVIYSEESADSLRKFAERLERYDAAMRTLRGLPEADISPSNRLTIYGVSNVADVQRLFGSGGSNVGGFYMPRAIGSIAVVPRRSVDGDAENTLLHEYAHHFLYGNFPFAYPAWFSEGYAEFHSTARFEKDGSVGIGLPAGHRAYGLYRLQALPIEKLLSSTVWGLNSEQMESLYGRGWLLTHYLMFEPKRQGQLVTYLHALNTGKPPLDAARGAFGDLKVLNEELGSYLRRKTMPYMRVGAAKLRISPVAVRDLSPAEDAVMDLKIRSKRGVDPQQAASLLPKMRRAATPFPNDPFVQATLAEAEYDAGNLAEAGAAADRALAADPKARDAMIYKAMVLADQAEKKPDAKLWPEVRRWLVAANRAEPDDAEPLMLFYQSFVREGAKPSKSAVAGLIRAQELAPQDQGLRVNATRALLADGKLAEARRMLAPLAFDPHGRGFSAKAAAVIGAMDKGGATAGLAALETSMSLPDVEVGGE